MHAASLCRCVCRSVEHGKCGSSLALATNRLVSCAMCVRASRVLVVCWWCGVRLSVRPSVCCLLHVLMRHDSHRFASIQNSSHCLGRRRREDRGRRQDRRKGEEESMCRVAMEWCGHVSWSHEREGGGRTNECVTRSYSNSTTDRATNTSGERRDETRPTTTTTTTSYLASIQQR